MNETEKIQLVIRTIMEKPPEPIYPDLNEHIEKSKDFHRKAGDWDKEE